MSELNLNAELSTEQRVKLFQEILETVRVLAETEYSGTPDTDELTPDQNESTPSPDTNATDGEDGGSSEAAESKGA